MVGGEREFVFSARAVAPSRNLLHHYEALKPASEGSYISAPYLFPLPAVKE